MNAGFKTQSHPSHTVTVLLGYLHYKINKIVSELLVYDICRSDFPAIYQLNVSRILRCIDLKPAFHNYSVG